MRRAGLAISALVLLLAPAVLADGEGDDGPRLHVSEKEVRFDEVVAGAVVDLEVTLENRGSAPLHIRRAEPTCGCTVSRRPREPIPPGGSAPLALRFDSTDREGTQSFEVHVYSDDPTQSDRGPYCTVLRVRGGVRDLYRLRPRGAYYGEFVRGGEAAERVVRATGSGAAGDGFTAEVASEQPDWLEADVRTTDAGVAVTVRVLPHAPPGSFLHRIVLATDVEEQPRFSIPVSGVVSGIVQGPGRVVLEPASREELGEPRVVPLERRDGRDGIDVRGVEYDEDLLDVEAEPLTPRRVDLAVAVAPGAPPGPFAAVVRVRLDVQSAPVVEVPVYGRVPEPVVADPPEVLLRDGRGSTTIRGAEADGVRTAPADAGLEARLVATDAPGHRVEVHASRPPSGEAVLIVETAEGALRVPISRQ